LKLLFLTSNLPWPLEFHGGAQRTALMLDALRRFAEVDLAYVHWSEAAVQAARHTQVEGHKIVSAFHVPEHRDPVRRSVLSFLPLIGKPFRTADAHVAWYQPDAEFSGWLSRTASGGHYDAVISRYLWPGAVGGLAGLRNVPKLLDWDDLDHLKLESQLQAKPWQGPGGRLAARLTRKAVTRYCLDAASSYDHVWVAKAADCRHVPAKSVSVLPNIPFPEAGSDHAQAPAPGKHRDIVFIGNLSYLPNAEGFSWFLMNVWPQVFNRFPDACLTAIGVLPPPETKALWDQARGVHLTGPVPELAPYYAGAALSICPVQWGGGSNIKAIESLGYGVPCVVSSYTFKAFSEDFGDSSGMIHADTAEEFVNACIRLLSDPGHGADIGRAGRNIVDQRYSLPRLQSLLQDGLRGAGLAVPRAAAADDTPPSG